MSDLLLLGQAGLWDSSRGSSFMGHGTERLAHPFWRSALGVRLTHPAAGPARLTLSTLPFFRAGSPSPPSCPSASGADAAACPPCSPALRPLGLKGGSAPSTLPIKYSAWGHQCYHGAAPQPVAGLSSTQTHRTTVLHTSRTVSDERSSQMCSHQPRIIQAAHSGSCDAHLPSGWGQTPRSHPGLRGSFAMQGGW